jgi:hypothetical protein
MPSSARAVATAELIGKHVGRQRHNGRLWLSTCPRICPVFRADIRGERQVVDYIDGKGGTRTLDPGIMRTEVALRSP